MTRPLPKDPYPKGPWQKDPGQKDPWELKFRALARFKARTRHCAVPPQHREDGIRLGRWVIDQRRAFAIGKLPNDRMLRLQQIGLSLKPRENGWHAAIAALSKYRQREGHCNAAKGHSEGAVNLGEWLANIRKRWHSLPAQRQRQLASLGFTISTQQASWQRHFGALLRFRSREGHCLVPRTHVERGMKLGVWVNNQRSAKAQMSSERKLRLDAIGFVWNTKRKLRPTPTYATGGKSRYRLNSPAKSRHRLNTPSRTH